MKQSTRQRWGRWVLIALALVAASVATMSRLETTFDVSAETETLRVQSGAMTWLLDRVALSEGYGGRADTVSGILDLESGTEIVFERAGLGPLNIVCGAPRAGSIGTFRPGAGDRARQIGARAVLVINQPSARGNAGRPVVLPIVGTVELGRVVGVGSAGPVLRAARVMTLGHTLLGHGRYRAGEALLGPGDRLQVVGVSGPAVGLVKVDERPAFAASYRVLGREGLVSRYGGDGYAISTSLRDRLLNDGVVQGIWLTLFLILGWERRLHRRAEEAT